MPSRKVHNVIAEAIVGLPYDLANSVNAWKDAPAAYMGPSHRKVRHDLLSNIFIAMQKEDKEKALAAALLHDLLDDAASKDKKVRRAMKMLDATL